MKEADINKTAIISRLKAYRERNGARAYRIVAHYVGSKRISDDVLRAIVSNAYRISDEAWMRIDHGRCVPDHCKRYACSEGKGYRR